MRVMRKLITRKENIGNIQGFQWPYKAVSVLLASTTAWILLIIAYPEHFQANRWMGAIPAFQQMLFTLTIGHLLLHFSKRYAWLQWAGMLFAPVPHRSLGMLFSSMLTFYWLIGDWRNAAWDLYLFLHIILSFVTGATLALLVYYVLRQRFQQLQAMPFQMDRSRIDMFVGTLVASVLLGATFHVTSLAGEPAEGVLFPLMIGIWNIGITSVSALLVGRQPKQSRWWLFVSAASAVLMMVVAAELVLSYLPSFWAFNGREYSTSNALLAVELGLFAGWLAGIIIRFYDRIALWYIDFLLEQRAKRGIAINMILRVMINLILPVLPLALVSTALLGSYATGGLYGTSIALLGILSNVGLSMVIETNQLNAKKMSISATQRKKLELVSPSFPQAINQWSRRLWWAIVKQKTLNGR